MYGLHTGSFAYPGVSLGGVDVLHCCMSIGMLHTISWLLGGGESVSDNGEADAQKFFVRLRPLEGRMKTSAASETNHVGAKYAR